MLGEGGLAIPRDHTLAHLAGDGERLTGQHRGLVRDPHAHQIPLGIETRRQLVREPLEKLSRLAPALHVRTHDVRLVHVTHDEIPSSRVLGDLAGGRLRLLVIELAVDEGGETVTCV